MKLLNSKLDKVFPFMIPTAIFVGMFLGEGIAGFQGAVPWLFALVTFAGSLKLSFQDMKATLRRPKPIFVILLVLRILMPLLALLLGRVLFPDDGLTRTGLLLFALIPVGVNSAVWTVMFGGNLALSLSVIIIDTLLSPFVLPASLLLLTGTQVEMDTVGMMMSLLQMIVIPSLLGMLVNRLFKGELPSAWMPRFGLVSKLGLVSVVLINGGNVAPHFQEIDGTLVAIMGAIVLLATSAYVMSWGLAKFGKFGDADTVSIVFGGGMRNVSTGIVLAVAYFPAAAAVPVVTSIFFQQMICATFGHLMRSSQQRKLNLAKLRTKTS